MERPDDALLLVNGLIWSGRGVPPARRSEAIAISGGRVDAIGATAELRRRFPGRSELDVGGRTVVPGLIDGHNHSVRGGLTWTRELDWASCTTTADALAVLEKAVTAAEPGAWIAATGGWHPSQFGGWSPDPELLDRIAPDNPVFLQALYEFAVVNTRARQEVPDVPVSPGTGHVHGMPAYDRFLAAMGEPSHAQQRAGLAAMYRDFAGRGLVGVNDPGGFGMSRSKYDALVELWQAGGLQARLRLYFSSVDAGREVEQVGSWVRSAFSQAGDDLLRPIGIGEVVHFGCHDFEGLDDFQITDSALGELEDITRVVATAGLPMQIHGVLDKSITLIIDCWERVDRDIPLRELRFALAHCDRVSTRNIARMKRLGVGAIVDDRQAFRASASLQRWGATSLDNVPPLADLVAAGVVVGAGTDATRASSYDPWRAVAWLVEGASFDGSSIRAARHRLSREDALHAYTNANAWFTREENVRGRLDPGYLADLAVLDRDVFTVGADDLLGTRSELTLVGGSAVYSSGAIADLI